MKESIIKVLHYILGYERYLKIFSIFKIRTLSFDGRKSDFLFFNELLDENAKVVVIGACTGITTIPLAKDKINRKEINSIKIDVIKIVAENFEFQIFEGAKKIIENNKPLIYFELWDNDRRNMVLGLIIKYNYNVFYRKGNALIPFDKNNYSGKNFFFKPANA